jgi:transposase
MEKTDARKLKPEAQQQLRNQAIRLRKRGFTHQQIAETIGAHPTRVCRWCRAYEKSGPKAVAIQKRGRKPGSGRTLIRKSSCAR